MRICEQKEGVAVRNSVEIIKQKSSKKFCFVKPNCSLINLTANHLIPYWGEAGEIPFHSPLRITIGSNIAIITSCLDK